jgi:two-component system, OmpR family, KDP operon response regulator KdpE
MNPRFRVLQTALVDQEYEAVGARTGEEALERLRKERFDLVLLDVNMPGIGGLETCREIRASSEAAIIMLTVRGSEQDKVAALDAGADDYVTKPFGMKELLARIRAALRRAPTAPGSGPQTFSSDYLEVDFEKRIVRAGGNPVRLTPKEFELLRYLIAHRGRPVPHRELLQAVWGPDYGDQTDYLRVFITTLRKKIEPEPSSPRFVLTEPWVGYRFVE